MVGRPDSMALTSHPIDPAWIRAGNPQARSANHSENFDGWAGAGVWDCTAGTFDWHFGWEETLMILEGEVHVTDDHGAIQVLREGDVAYFAAGSHFVWHVPVYVRKLVFYRREVPRALRHVHSVITLPKRLAGRVIRAVIALARRARPGSAYAAP